MHLFVLGMFMGAGLILAWQEIQFQFWLHKETQLRNAQDKAIALLTECTCWGGPTDSGDHAYYCVKSNSVP